MKTFGKRLKEVRVAKGMAQRQLAEVLNVSSTTVHCWETDKQEPSLSTVLFLSDYFDVSLDYLFGKSDY